MSRSRSLASVEYAGISTLKKHVSACGNASSGDPPLPLPLGFGLACLISMRIRGKVSNPSSVDGNRSVAQANLTNWRRWSGEKAAMTRQKATMVGDVAENPLPYSVCRLSSSRSTAE